MEEKMEEYSIPGAKTFKFSAVKPEELEETEYTLATVVMDVTGSLQGYEEQLRDCLVTIAEACKMSPRSDFIMLRVVMFNSTIGVKETHGFKCVQDIDVNDYKRPTCDALTPLYDAVYSSIGATLAYAENLRNQDFEANGCAYIVTDGMDNASKMGMADVKAVCDEARKEEKIETLLSVLIGLNTSQCGSYLSEFKDKAGLTEYIDAGDLSKEKLAKISGFISSSISSQSQCMGTGTSASQMKF